MLRWRHRSARSRGGRRPTQRSSPEHLAHLRLQPCRARRHPDRRDDDVSAATGEGNGRIRSSADGGGHLPSTTVATPAFCGGHAARADQPRAPTWTMRTRSSGWRRTRHDDQADDERRDIRLLRGRADADTHAIAFAPSNPNIVYTGNDGGVWRSNDAGANWLNRTRAGLSATTVSRDRDPQQRPVVRSAAPQDNGTRSRRRRAATGAAPTRRRRLRPDRPERDDAGELDLLPQLLQPAEQPDRIHRRCRQ